MSYSDFQVIVSISAGIKLAACDSLQVCVSLITFTTSGGVLFTPLFVCLFVNGVTQYGWIYIKFGE